MRGPCGDVGCCDDGATGGLMRILFVCLGNICRSPAAEGVLRDLAQQDGAALTIDSAGTSNWHLGAPPHPPMINTARARGVELSGLSARQFEGRDFERFDLILGMDGDNIANIERLRPANNATPVRLFLDYTPDSSVRHVPDPYYTGDYETALDLIENAARALLVRLG
jgi:low molecular weight protein-tyrosine phosphatase